MIENSNSSNSLIALLINIFKHVKRRRRNQFFLLMGLALISSIAEVVSLGSVVPFIGVLTQPEKVFEYPIVSNAANLFGISSSDNLVLPLTMAFAIAALIAGSLRLILQWVSIRLANSTGADLSVEVYRRTLYQPYSVHVARSSSEIISGITQKVASATGVLVSLVTAITSTILFVAILATLLLIDPVVAFGAMFGFGLCYALIAWTTRNRLRRNSVCIAEEQTRVVKSLQEGLGAIRDVLLDGVQAIYSNSYSKAIHKLQRARGENLYITVAPRFAMESLGMVMIAVLAFVMSGRSGGVGAALPILGALALGAQRLLPLLQILYGNWANVSGNRAALVDVLNLLEQPLPDHINHPLPKPLLFNEIISFDNVCFRYKSETPWVLDGISLDIPKGARVGFIGSTGSGKSTALDLFMSLLEFSDGNLYVDKQPISSENRRAWQSTIAHVPQNIFLADASIAENIAFGISPDQIDMDRVRRAANQAQISEFIESGPEKYDAIVGERGVRLSGGQRQRIGIARALYKESTVLVLDEATSALDSVTEKAVMDAIGDLNRNLTILIIAHRLTTLKTCDLIVKLEHGKIVAKGTYESMIKDDSVVAKLEVKET